MLFSAERDRSVTATWFKRYGQYASLTDRIQRDERFHLTVAEVCLVLNQLWTKRLSMVVLEHEGAPHARGTAR